MARFLFISLALLVVAAQAQTETGMLASEIMAAVAEAAEAVTDIEISRPCERWVMLTPSSDYHQLCARFLIPLQLIQDTVDAASGDKARVEPWMRDGVVVSTVVKAGEAFIIIIVVDVAPRSLTLMWSPSAP